MNRALLLTALLVLATPAAAQGPGLVMEKMTSYEIRDAIAAGKTTVILPSGGTEQNGPHMVIGKHNMRVAANAQAIARKLGNALVAPVIVYVPEGTYTPPSGHLRYPGTLGVTEEVYAGVVEGAARSLKLAGFKDIVLIGDHGSDQAGQDAVAAKLNREWAGSGVRVHAIGVYYRGDAEGDAKVMMSMGIRRDEMGNHADVRDTSMMMGIDPAMVHNDRREAGTPKNGVEGDPRRATAEIGRALNARVVDRTIAAIKASLAAR